MQALAAERAGGYSIEKMSRSYRDLYEELAAKESVSAAPAREVSDSFQDVIAGAALMETEELLGSRCGSLSDSPEEALLECVTKNSKSLQRQRPEFYRRVAELVGQ